MEGRVRKICEVCGSNVGFTQSEDGAFYCSNCNSQAEDMFDTGVDEEDLFTHYTVSCNRVRSTNQTLASQIQLTASLYSDHHDAMDEDLDGVMDDGEGNLGPNDFGSNGRELTNEEYYRAIRSRYVMGIQIMIQMQCKALVDDFKVSPLIVGLVGPIWLRYLASTRVLADEWADNALHESETQTQGEPMESQPRASYRREPLNIYGKRLVYVWCKSLRSSIPISTSLAISFLVCHIARESVLPSDMLKWVLEGKLPYFAAFREIEKRLGSNSDACPISASRMFRPITAISSQKLESVAAAIARRIGLDLPPVNFYAIASRFCVQLSMPTEQILPLACRICQWSMPSELYLPANELRIPTRAFVMSILVVAVRILFDINGYGAWESNLSHSNEEDDRMRRGDEASSPDSSDPLCSPKLSVGELLRILETKYTELDDGFAYSSDLDSYLKYCRDVVFSGLWPSFENIEEEKLIEELWEYYEKNNGNGSNRNGESSQSISHNSNDSQQNDQSQPSTSISIEDLAIRRLKMDMEENKFSYIPPRVNTNSKRYLHYARKRKGVYVYAVHADYYILLRSCAKVSQVEPRILHVAVLTLERKLKWLESKMASALDFRLDLEDDCDICREGDSTGEITAYCLKT